MSLEDFIINVYCLVDEMLEKIVGDKKLRERGFEPSLSDAEIIALEVIAEFLGIDTDKGAWEYFSNHWLAWFPKIGSRANFAKHAANMWRLKQQIQKLLAKKLGAFSDGLHLVDGFPMLVCQLKRAYFNHSWKGIASYGYCASKAETYYGFKGNLLINSEGVITDITITQANVDERISLWDMLGEVNGQIIADKGLIGHDYRSEVQQFTGIDLQTAARANMKDLRSKKFIKWLTSTRRLIETVIGQLAERFHIETVRARKLWYFTNRVARKILAHTIGVFLNKQNNSPPLQFDLLINSGK